jgi:hypothetical protein
MSNINWGEVHEGEEYCEICHPELVEAPAPAPAPKSTRKPVVSNPRRKSINHLECAHAQTPAARRACRKAHN